jgi:hypothetical protein
MWWVFERDQEKIKALYTYCEQASRRGKDYEMKPRLIYKNEFQIYIRVPTSQGSQT